MAATFALHSWWRTS
ncbi:TPA: trp operon leader peptide [Salmonella enterica subsp. enterica serovar Infantis]|uniref:trp operon leader peptide n=2 Tax=Salmonella enterica I TaxID=59201 RepID=A0A5R1YFF8_SALIN|nr:trp operon leader peptide [Salmonella enterica]EBH8067203.1 trp operon leader peptide [Salmonella bongori]EDU5886519.1 trp operon leader peptide [Salmonella enterica subsp. enterica serovar Hillingdon]EHX1433938.1 trp operon leader peptide [Salmonella enterica subsp. enterica serovar Orion]HCL0934298.1 trp operon leader peptide [Salmonella enterica subsp. enterica serovar Pomona]EAB5816534.1 trp operon leader peptide [Salmonella enterica subsp. enterica serovar Infantis]